MVIIIIYSVLIFSFLFIRIFHCLCSFQQVLFSLSRCLALTVMIYITL